MAADEVEGSSEIAEKEECEYDVPEAVKEMLEDVRCGDLRTYRLRFVLKVLRRGYPWDFLNLSCRLIGRARELIIIASFVQERIVL